MSVMDKFLAIQNQKKRADAILRELETIDPNVILAGGAPRNWYFNEEANDLDFYIYHRNFKALDDKLSALTNVIQTGYSEGTGIPDEYKNKNLKAVYSYNTRVKSYVERYNKIQIMIMKEPITPEYILNDFPVNISMIFYKQGKIIPTEDFLIAITHKIIFLNPSSMSRDNSKYLRKIHGYYPDYLWLEERPKFFTLPVVDSKPKISVRSGSGFAIDDLINGWTTGIKTKYYTNSNFGSNLTTLLNDSITTTVNTPYPWSVPIVVANSTSTISLSITDDVNASNIKDEIVIEE